MKIILSTILGVFIDIGIAIISLPLLLLKSFFDIFLLGFVEGWAYLVYFKDGIKGVFVSAVSPTTQFVRQTRKVINTTVVAQKQNLTVSSLKSLFTLFLKRIFYVIQLINSRD